MSSWPLIANFDGGKFAARYGLSDFPPDFWASGNRLYVKDSITLPDNPPIFESTDPRVDKLAALKTAIDAYINRAAPPIDPAIKLIFQEWRKIL